MNRKKTAVIAGAGPAGLTIAYELLTRTDILPIIYEKTSDIGGLSKTVNHNGNRIDIGGHRFFSKSDRVMDWWLKILPLDNDVPENFSLMYKGKFKEYKREHLNNKKELPNFGNKNMLIRQRVSRIYFLRKFFKYPIAISLDTVAKLGLIRTVKILASYLSARLRPIKIEKNLEDFFINRFGKELYNTFFKAYTEKVWGKPCTDIPSTWGRQRIKKLSIYNAIRHATIQKISKQKNSDGIGQKNTDTSLIEQFLYPKYGPGQLWEEVADQITALGGVIIYESEVIEIHLANMNVTGINIKRKDESTFHQPCDYFCSTMPVKQLIGQLMPPPPPKIRSIADGLEYRDFLTVGLLLKKFGPKSDNAKKKKPMVDNWIYIQEKDVQVGRIQIFNNWSPFMVANESNVWIGMEYFCNQEDEIWNMQDSKIANLAVEELKKLSFADESDLLDNTVIRMEKAYPGYFGSYKEFNEIIKFTDEIENLFLIGRNGMHRYNNSDHSMLTAMIAVDNILAGTKSKKNLWEVNTEDVYHENKQD